MKKLRYTIISNNLIALRTYRLELACEDPQYQADGEFVDIAVPGFYLRRPVSICDRGPGRITLIYKTVGKGTEALAGMAEGGELELLTGLGRGFDASKCRRKALLVAGGLGAAPLYPLCKELTAAGKQVSVLLCFNTAAEIVLVDEFKALTPDVTVVTVDGSAGVKGFFSDALGDREYDMFYTCGPLVMMKAACNTLPGDGEASLEERMGCGSGFCYGCSIQTAGGIKRVCKDGPVFGKEEIIW